MEIGQVTRANVSGYTRSRVHLSNLYAQETRGLSANFNGAIPVERTIESATWQTWNTAQIVMSAAALSDNLRETSIRIRSQVGGPCVIKCSVTLDNGDVYVQNFRVNVIPAPIYSNTSWSTGPESVTVTAP